jgi:SAM-dependent methyltransferase
MTAVADGAAEASDPTAPPGSGAVLGSDRSGSFGEHAAPSPVDRFGVWLSSVAVRRNADFDDVRLGDFGCGFDASFTRTQLGHVRHALLVDLAIAPDLKGNAKVTAIEGSIPDVLPTIETGSLDVTMCLSVLEHLWDPEGALRELRRVTRPGGLVLVNVPSWAGKRALELSAFRLHLSPAEEMDDHKWYFDPRDLWPMLVRVGFKPSQIRCHRHKFGLNTFAACRVTPTTGADGLG